MKNLSTASYKGARDLYPQDKQLQNYIFKVWARTCQQFGFLEYGAPLLENIDVYKAKSGEELVNEQTYAFTDRGDRQVAIRPEMTPTISRMVAAKRQELAYPARLFSIANFMRYERPQKGREREFWQLNADIFGDDSIFAELDLIKLSHQILLNFGADQSMFTIKINDRRLIDAIFNKYLGLDDEQSHKLAKLFDQKAKISAEAYRNILTDLLNNNTEKINEVLALDKAELPKFVQSLPEYTPVQQLLAKLTDLGITNAEFDIFLMRGLDYYTGTVFEVFDTDPTNNRSLFGGGRYDGLVSYFGAEPISAVGVAPGASTCLEFLIGHNLLPDYLNSTNYLILTMGATQLPALQLASQLRTKGLNIDIDPTDKKLAKKLKSATKKGIDKVIIIGEEEIKNKVYTIKDLTTGQEEKLELKKIQ